MKNISVIGSGTMGNGIAQTFALFNFSVTLYDISSESLDKGEKTILRNLQRMVNKDKITQEEANNTVANIKYTTNFDSILNSELIIEAVSENLELKESIFKELDLKCPNNTILASNTSSISITKLAEKTKRKDKVIGMHFMNPVPIMQLVEIINGYSTSDTVTNTIEDLSKTIGKIPAMSNDYPGFIANRILMPMINEAIWTLHEGVGDVNNIDNVMKLGMAHPMGPLQLADFIGLDVCLAILEVLYEGFGNPKYAPCPLLVNMVNAGKKGVKSGEGFYSWTHGTKELVVSSSFH